MPIWQEVLKEIRYSGRYRKPKFTDPKIYKAIDRIGGWTKLCITPIKKINQIRNEFYSAYKEKIEYGNR